MASYNTTEIILVIAMRVETVGMYSAWSQGTAHEMVCDEDATELTMLLVGTDVFVRRQQHTVTKRGC